LLELAAASVVACVTASRKIKWLLDRKNTRRKADGSFVTDADYSAQGVIVEAIRRVSASVRIIGEESAEEMQVHVGRFEEEEQEGDKGNQDQRESKAEMYRRLDQDILERTREELRIRLRSAGVESKGGDSSDDTAAESSCGPAATLPLSETPVLPEKDARIAGANNSPAASSAPHPLPGTSREATPAATGPPPESSAAAAVVDVSRVSVIVDPLDGTKSYAHGDYDSVSILIGIVLDGHDPCFGVIGKPFGYTGLTPIRDTGCVAIYGGSLVKGVYVAGRALPVLPPPLPLQEGKYDRSASPNDGACPPPPELRADQEPANKRQKRRMLPRAVISSSRSRGVVEEFCSHLGQQGLIDPEPMLISGAGEKSLRLILGTNNEALWFFPKGGTSRWDVAAPDALLRQLGGKITDKHGNFLDYSKDREDAENVEGIIASNDANLHAECIRLFLEGDWVDRD
jgi:3'-phosphoadenosine 5'-phosphosulfate (PAPS) 3'-phosphatase